MLLKAQDVCEMLNISNPTLHRLRRRGIIKSIKIGGCVRFKEEWIEEIIKNTVDTNDKKE